MDIRRFTAEMWLWCVNLLHDLPQSIAITSSNLQNASIAHDEAIALKVVNLTFIDDKGFVDADKAIGGQLVCKTLQGTRR